MATLDRFSLLEHKTINENTHVVDPFIKENNVTLDSPAINVMTDFQHIIPASIESELTIDSACERMKAAKIRLLFVVNEIGSVIGLITATDLLGETPVKLSQELRIPRAELKISQLMTSFYKLTAIHIDTVENSKVGHIAKTLSELGRQHTLVVETNNLGDEVIRGMFSNNQVCKQLGYDSSEILGGNKTLLDLIEANA